MYTSPSFPYKSISMLRMSKVSLELITDAHMLLSVQSAVRGGLVQCCQRYARTNYPLLSNPSKDYKTSEPGSYLQMLLALTCMVTLKVNLCPAVTLDLSNQ